MTAIKINAMQWHRIDDPEHPAPKDGTKFLAVFDGTKVLVTHWIDNSKSQYPWAGWKPPSMKVVKDGTPTHWHPLPPAPEQT